MTTETIAPKIIRTETRDGITRVTRVEFGSAARMNRGSYSGQKIHRLISEYIVAVEEGTEVKRGTFAAEFIRTGKPVQTSCFPACGCTMGQFAGRPAAHLTAADVTCSKCG
jgi:hypothetical protein